MRPHSLLDPKNPPALAGGVCQSASDLAEMGSDLPWDDAETVAWLVETWQEAQPRLERVWALVNWCSPQAVGPPDGERLDSVVDLLLQAHRTEKRDE